MDKTKEFYDTLLDASFNKATSSTFRIHNFEQPSFTWNEELKLYISKQSYSIENITGSIVVHLDFATAKSGKDIIEATLMFGTFLDNGHFDAEGYFDNVFYYDGEWQAFDEASDEVLEYIKSQPLDGINDLLMQYQEFNIGGVT